MQQTFPTSIVFIYQANSLLPDKICRLVISRLGRYDNHHSTESAWFVLWLDLWVKRSIIHWRGKHRYRFIFFSAPRTQSLPILVEVYCTVTVPWHSHSGYQRLARVSLSCYRFGKSFNHYVPSFWLSCSLDCIVRPCTNLNFTSAWWSC